MDWKTVIRKVELMEKGKEDIKVPAVRLTVNEDYLITPVSHLYFTDLALSQLCSKLSIPYRYIDKCKESYLFAENLNYWLSRNMDTFLLRTRGEDIRAVLSDKYAVLDNIDIINALPNMNVKDFITDDHYFNLRCIFDKKINIVKKDPIYLGVNISNSEVGLRKAVIEICLWRQVCSNGLIICDKSLTLFNKRHIFVKKDTLKEDFAVALSEAFKIGDKYLTMMKESTKIKIKNPEEYIEDKLKDFSKNFIDKVVETIEDTNKYSIINAITESAKILPIPQRIEAEKVAGQLLIA